MRTTMRLINNGKITIPSHIRDEYGLEDGDLVEADITPVPGTEGGVPAE